MAVEALEHEHEPAPRAKALIVTWRCAACGMIGDAPLESPPPGWTWVTDQHLACSERCAWSLHREINRYDPEVLEQVRGLLECAALVLAQRMLGSLQKRAAELDEAGAERPKRDRLLLLRMGWYERRIDGLWETCDDVEVCGQRPQILRCMDCGYAWVGVERCTEGLLCNICRDAEIKERRARLEEQLKIVEAEARPYWRRKFLTTTVPHAGTLEQRVQWGTSARVAFARTVRDYLREKGEAWHWWAALECTEGDDDEGHVHWHWLVVGPFLPDPLLATWWARALRSRGCPITYRPLTEAIDRIVTLCPPRFRAEGEAELVRLAEIPWSVPGASAPRRERGELAGDYIVRRAAWAAAAGDAAKRIPLAKVYGRLRAERPRELPRAVLDVATLPHAVVDIRTDDGRPVIELVKYTIKAQTMRAPVIARFVAVLKALRARTFQSSAGDGLERTGEGCPNMIGGKLVDGVMQGQTRCGSKRIRIERPQYEPAEKLARLSRYLSGELPELVREVATRGPP